MNQFLMVYLAIGIAYVVVNFSAYGKFITAIREAKLPEVKGMGPQTRMQCEQEFNSMLNQLATLSGDMGHKVVIALLALIFTYYMLRDFLFWPWAFYSRIRARRNRSL